MVACYAPTVRLTCPYNEADGRPHPPRRAAHRLSERGDVPGRATDRTGGAKILDAALRVLVDFGVKRATVDLVANYAGVSHMTVYRRWSTRNEVLRVAVLNELAVVVQHAVTRVEGGAGSFPDQVVSAFTELVDSLRRHPLLVRVLSTEPRC